ncbi:MAG: type II toxin-antitoxin system mRNA interferase toxin, RelE/StbE family [Thermodesulfobacteriota bacterium]
MRRTLHATTAFSRGTKRLLRKWPEMTGDLEAALQLLAEAFRHPSLKSHKLKGNLEGLWAASLGYDLRIVFELVEWEGSEGILLHTLGPHDEVY